MFQLLYEFKAVFFVCYRAVTDSINMLLNACMSAAPGQKECDNALRNIQVWTYYVISQLVLSPKMICFPCERSRDQLIGLTVTSVLLCRQ